MKIKCLLFLLIAAAPLFLKAQGIINIFSEDGDKFYLLINGVKQNEIPQTNVRVDGLVAVNYKAKILFEDNSKAAVSSNVYTQNALTHEYVEATYRIKRVKKGALKLRLFSSTPIVPNYTPAPDVYVTHYGAPPPPPASPVASPVPPDGNASININVPHVSLGINAQGQNNASMNLNVNVDDPQTRNTQPQTPPPPPSNRRRVGSSDCHWPMANNAFQPALADIRSELSSTTRENKASAILANNCLSTDQVIEVSKALGSDIDRLIFVRKAFPRVTDQGSYSRVQYIFEDQLRIKEFKEFLAENGL